MRPLIAFATTAAFVFSTGLASSPAEAAKIRPVAYMGSKALQASCARGGGTFNKSTAVSHSCKYKNGNTRDCSSKSRTCVMVIPRIAPQGTGVGGVPAGGGAVYATTTLECGSKKYEVSTGTKGGNCSHGTNAAGKPEVNCGDQGNKTSANCSTGCGNSEGAGSCTVKDRTAGQPSGPRPRGKPGIAVIPPVGGSILDGGSGFGSQGPASTGAPMSTGGGSAPPPQKIY